MASPNTQERAKQRQAESMFPGDRIQGSPQRIPTFEEVRTGDAEVANIPLVLPCNRKPIQDSLKRLRENRFDRSNPQDVAEYSSLLRRSVTNDDIAEEVAEYRTFELVNDVMAAPFALAAFQNVNLSSSEMPLIIRPRSRNLQRFTVKTIGQDGGAESDQWRTTKSAEQLELEMISTPKVEWPLIDLEQGDVSQADAVDQELRYEMEMKIDQLALANIDGAKTVSGLRDELNIHPLVDVNNIPDTNYLDLSSVSPGVLTIDKLKQILLHMALFGSAGGADLPFVISNIFLSPQNLRDSWDFIDLVSGLTGVGVEDPALTVTTSVREQIFATGQMTSAWGYSWSWTPNTQLAKGKMYITSSQPLGWFFTKTELDRTISWSDQPDNIERNLAEMLLRRAIGFYVPSLWKSRVLIVDL